MITVINKGFETETIYSNEDKMNNINKRSDLYREYAKVIDMCEGTNVKPYECVKSCGITLSCMPELDGEVHTYEFAIAIVEDRSVFIGDELWYTYTKDFATVVDVAKYNEDGTVDTVRLNNGNNIGNISELSWNKPKPKTFNLNGVDVDLPNTECTFNIGDYYFYIKRIR